MPADAPRVKVEGTRGEGAEIVFYDRRTESREEIAATIAAESGATVVPSFDDPAIVAGQGTLGLEIVEQLGRPPARIVIPCGGGGLASGIALAVPEAEIVVVEPEGWDDMGRSLDLGEIVPVEPDAPNTFCDAIRTPRVSPITLGILSDRSAKALFVSDTEVAEAIRFAWTKHQIVVEPGAAPRPRGAAVGQACAAGGYSRRVVGRKCRPGASRRDHERTGLSDVAGLIFAGFDMGRARPLDRLGQLFQLGGQSFEFGGKKAPLVFGDRLRTRRSACRASSRCTAGSFPRSARTPHRDAPAGQP